MNQHLLAATTPTPTPTPTAELAGVSLAYTLGEPVLRGLDWRLLPGQVVGLLGRNGAGKSTLLQALLGLLEPQAGVVRLFEQPVGSLDDAARSRIGYVPQQSDLFEASRRPSCWPTSRASTRAGTRPRWKA